MTQIKVRWGDLGEPGTYHYESHKVEVTPGDIKLANGNPDTVIFVEEDRKAATLIAIGHARRPIP